MTNLIALTFLAQEGAPAGNPLESMAPIFLLIAVFVVFVFFTRRSQKRQEGEHRKMVENLDKGTRVMLNSGLIARVEKIDKEASEAKLLIDEDKKVYAIYSLQAIAKVFEEKKSSVKED